MEMRIERKMVQQEFEIWTAYDGKEFKSRLDCEIYEKNLKRKTMVDEAEKLRIKHLDRFNPLDIDGMARDEQRHTWFELKDEKDWKTLQAACVGKIKGDKPETYPCIICLEEDGDVYGDYPWAYTLEEMMKATKYFWKKFGYEVDLKKVK